MKGVKIGSIFAVCGFILSFLSGLFSHTSILSVLLKALIFAIIFGVLGFLISFVFEKFLDEGSSGDSDFDTGVVNISKTSASPTGQVVDITIQDEDLSQSDSDNHFVVDDRHQMLNPTDFGRGQKVAEPSKPVEENGFVPLKNFETLKGLSGKESVSRAEVESAPSVDQAMASAPMETDEIDTLPDMGSLAFGTSEESDSDDEDSDIETDSDFVSSANVHKKDENVPEVKDAALIAKAISSVLADENSI